MSANTSTINKLVSIFRDMSIRHKMITDFGFGPIWDSNGDNRKFPYMYVEPLSSTMLQSTSAASGHMSEQYAFRLAEMDQHVMYVDMDIRLVNNVQFTPVYEATSDDINGWQCDITLQMPMRFNPCNSPIQPISSYLLPLSTTITDFRLQGAQGATGSSSSVPGPVGPLGPTGPIGPAGVGIQFQGELGSTASLPTPSTTGFAYLIGPDLWIYSSNGWVDGGNITGPQGNPGTNGTSGTSGTSGTTGTSGTSGKDGSDAQFIGATGSAGTSGINGTSGTTGTSGTSGTSGTRGT